MIEFDIHETIFIFWQSKYILQKHYFDGGQKFMHVSYNEWSLVTTHTTPAEPWLYYYPLVTDYLHLFFQDTYIHIIFCL